MRLNFTYIISVVFCTFCHISSVCSIWIVVPSTGFRCGAKALLTNYNLADAVEPGCKKMARARHHKMAILMPIRRLFFPEVYKGPLFSGSHPLYMLKIKIDRSQGIFQYPKYKAIFEWNEKQGICIPHGVLAIIKSGSLHKCSEINYPGLRDKYFDGSSEGGSRSFRDPESMTIRSHHSLDSRFDFDKLVPFGFFSSYRSIGKNELDEEYFKGLKEVPLNSPIASPSSKKTSSHLSDQNFDGRPENLSRMKSLPHLLKAFPPSTDEPSPQIQRSFSTPTLNMEPKVQRARGFHRTFRQKSNLGPLNLAQNSPVSSETKIIPSQQQNQDYSEKSKRQQPKANTPLKTQGLISKIIIENPEEMGLLGLLDS